MPHRSFQRFLVYIEDEDCHGVVLSLGAYASMVKYYKDGIDHEVLIPNEDLIFLDEISIGLEEEDI